MMVPLLNLAVSGASSALIALFFDLEKLVEFMSIGTLLAYTIVSASVIILRYKADTSKRKLIGDDVSLSTASIESETSYLLQNENLKPEFWWLTHIFGGCEHGVVISGAVIVYMGCCVFLSIHVHFLTGDIMNRAWWAILILIFLVTCSIGCLIVIGAHRQNPANDAFRVPWVPLVPGLSILCNVGLMVHLNVLTWVRFTVWMMLGLLVYFLYGIKHSKESDMNNTYSMLITSSEANKESWGAVNTRSDPEESKSLNEQIETQCIVTPNK